MAVTLIVEARAGAARAGVLTTPHGALETPAFMPVGTAGTVKAMDPDELSALGYRMLLGNTYHLMLRPGAERVAALGGLHRMMAWPGALLTDSGGYQVFSLGRRVRLSEDGATFRSHLDGSEHVLTPERAMAIQEALGADVAMALDHCPALPAPRAEVEAAVARTSDWLARCVAAHRRDDQALFGIVQGGTDPALRRRSVEEVCAFDLPGYAVGGLSVGEEAQAMWETAAATAALLPADRPRYLMGVGTPDDLLQCVQAGIDLFDCVLPTRCARNGLLFTSRGDLVVTHARWKDEPGPPDPRCDCPTCRRFSLAYLRHLHQAREVLGLRLNTIHNLAWYRRLVGGLREAIGAGDPEAYVRDVRARREELGARIRSRWSSGTPPQGG